MTPAIPVRREYIDWARGVAVLLMIEAHTADAWTRAASKSSTAFRNATILGGFAAPLFLWLAGVGVALSASRTVERTGSRGAAVASLCRRGLEIFLLAFLFRVQAFIVSPGSHPITLFRVDILNVMGLAMVAAGLLWACANTTVGRLVAFASAAAVMAMVTPIVRLAAGVDMMPTWVQWYIKPAGEHTTFTLFPWAGFVFAGAATGVLIACVRDADTERRLQVALGVTGVALVALGFYTATQPSIYRAASFWTSSPTWFAIRMGVVMIGVAVLGLVERQTIRLGLASVRAALGPLATLGRASLFVYWIHVELVYGYASWFIRGRLPLWGTALGCAAFVALMHRAVILRDRHFSDGFRFARPSLPARQNAIR